MLCFNESLEEVNVSGNCSGEDVFDNNTLDDTSRSLQEAFNRAQYVICPVLFVVGIAGNTLTIVTVTKPQFRQLTSRYILCALAMFDSLLLLTNPFNQQFMQSVFARDVRALSKFGCKLFFIAYRTGKIMASWCVVLVAMERFIAVMFPFRVKTIVTKGTTTVTILAVFTLVVTFSVLWMFSTEIVAGVCLPDAATPDNKFLHKRFVVAGAVIYSIAPIVILSSITPPIIIRLVRQQHARKGLHSSATSRFARETNRTTTMLSLIVLVYVICVTPITLVLVLTFWTNEPIFGSSKKEFIILTSVAQSFEQINHSMNFTIYVLCSSQFRLGFLKMIGCTGREQEAPSSSFAQMYAIQTASSGTQGSYPNLAICNNTYHNLQNGNGGKNIENQ